MWVMYCTCSEPIRKKHGKGDCMAESLLLGEIAAGEARAVPGDGV